MGIAVYDPKTGVFFELSEEEFPGENKYRFESTYFIRYSVAKAIYAYDRLLELSRDEHPDITLCHIYSDLLFEACGMICKRFITGKGPDNQRKQNAINRREYEYDEEAYNMLELAKEARDYVEHIEERNDTLIQRDGFRGTFNVLFKGMDSKLYDELCDSEKPLYGLLNLEDMTFVGFRKDTQKESGIKEHLVDFAELRQELEELKRTAEIIWNDIEMYRV